MPGPLATKIYHSQGSHRLRTALGHLYHQSSAKEHVNDSTCVDLKEEKTMLSSQVPYANRSLHEIHKEDVPQTKVWYSFPNSDYDHNFSAILISRVLFLKMHLC